jgi:signal transduction histidine kinase
MAKKNAELEKLNQEKNYFLGMAAHDLRTPLGVILTYAEFLESEAFEVLTEEQRDFITRIKGTSEFMLRIVSNLLDVAAIESGNLKLDLQFADLVSVIQRTVTLNRVLAAKKEITVDLSIQEVSARLVIDSGKIEQVLNNLIGNAVKFSHRGTSIQVSLTLDPHYATVIVQDHGQGIPAEDVAKLFKAFGKGSVRGTAGEKCTGLGLAICHRIVEGHGGRIWVESTAGRGASFFFTLPLAMKEGRGTKP